MSKTAKGIYYPGDYTSVADIPKDLKEMAESIEEVIENEAYDDKHLQQEISNIKSKNTEQDRTIQDNAESIEELKAENERLNNDINAISVTEQAEGENITLNDTAEARFKKFEVQGNSWQETGDVTDEEGSVIGAMPSTEFESPIRNVSGNANVTICNKNFFRLEDIQEKTGITKLENGFRIDRSGTYDTNRFSGKNLKAGYNYRVSCNIKYNNSMPQIIIELEDGTIEYHGFSSDGISGFSSKIGIKDYYFVINYSASSDSYVEMTNIQIEENTEATAYAEHKEQNFTFPLAAGQKLMKGDYLADNGIHHVRKQRVFDGTEDWIWRDTTRYSINLENIGGSNSMCSHYTYKKYSGGVTSTDKTFCVGDDLTYIGFFDAEITSLTKWKEYLAEQYANGTPVIVEYGLAEEEIEAYTEEQQAVYDEIKKTAHSYGEQTHIFCTDEISLIFSVEARKDMNTVISNLESMIISNASEEV